MFNWIRFSCSFEMSSDKLQNVSQSVSQCQQSWDRGRELRWKETVEGEGRGGKGGREAGKGRGGTERGGKGKVAPPFSNSWIRPCSCHQSVEVLSKSLTFLDFRFSQGSVATYCRWGDVYIENFLTNHTAKELWKSVHICRSYYQTSNSWLFNTVY